MMRVAKSVFMNAYKRIKKTYLENYDENEAVLQRVLQEVFRPVGRESNDERVGNNANDVQEANNRKPRPCANIPFHKQICTSV